MISVDMTESKQDAENVELFMRAIDLVMKNFKDRMGIDEVTHCLLSVGFDLLHHIQEHMAPGESPELHVQQVRNHIKMLLDKLEQDVWIPQQK